jgi:hypothetical protein
MQSQRIEFCASGEAVCPKAKMGPTPRPHCVRIDRYPTAVVSSPNALQHFPEARLLARISPVSHVRE